MRALTQARQAAGTEGGAAGWLKRASVVAEVIGVEDEVAVPGLQLDTLGDPLVEAADSCGAPVGYVSMVSATRSDDFNAGAGIKGRRTRAWGCADGKGEGGRRRREVEGAIDGTKGVAANRGAGRSQPMLGATVVDVRSATELSLPRRITQNLQNSLQAAG
jgi:hypothetical protein